VTEKIAVYTAIFGAYDDPIPIQQPDPDIAYLLFADSTVKAAPPPWQLCPAPVIFADPQRDARRLKTLAHLFLPDEYTVSVWVDGNCQIEHIRADAILELLGNADMALPAHAERTCIFAEGEALLALGLYDSPARIARQMTAYQIAGLPRDFGLHHTNFLIRRHNAPSCIQFCSEWWQQLHSYSKRDQLSFDFVRWKLPGSKIRTLQMSYNVNDLFRCSGMHKNPHRVVSEHLGAAVRCADLPQSFLAAAYDPNYEQWPAPFLFHLRRLNEIAAGAGEALEGNLCYFHQQRDFAHAPPDPRRGARRETFLRALAGRRRMLEIGFNAGHSALLALTHGDAIVTSIDDCSHAYTEPAAAYLGAAFPGRLRFFKTDSRRMPMLARELELGSHDLIHIDGGHAPDAFAADIATALACSKPGTLVLVDDLYVPAIRQISDRLIADRLLAPYGNLETAESGALLTLEQAQPMSLTNRDALANRLLNFLHMPRVTEETQTPFLSDLLQRLQAAPDHTAQQDNLAGGDAWLASGSALQLDDELIAEIERTGYHPFIIMRNARYPDEERFLICQTENQISEFTRELTQRRCFAESVLARGIERALHQDVANAADLFFSWSVSGVRQPERVYVGLPPYAELPSYYRYPIFEVMDRPNGGDAKLSIQQLYAMFSAYYHTSGNDRSRLALLEALAVALARSWALNDQFGPAAEIIAKVIRLNPSSAALKAAINALDLRSRATMSARDRVTLRAAE
jgi:predicted O-methyltransferase YrrM